MSKQEAKLKAACVEVIKQTLPGYVIIRHEDVRTNGIPDLSITGLARTTWLEFKHGDPKVDSVGIQELTMLRLALAGFARYIIYQEDKYGESKRTLIVHPKHLEDLEAEVWCLGFDHRFVAEYIRGIHEQHRTK